MDGNVEIQAIVHDPSDVLLLDPFLHEVHDPLVVRFQPEHDLETARVPHLLEQIAR